jgi:multidrug efflux pump subunit AcrB
MLIGIVTKNAIMLVDFAIESIHGGWNATPQSSTPARNVRGRSS